MNITVRMTTLQASAVLKALGERISQIDCIECNNESVRNELRAERAHLIAVMGEITLAEMP